MTTPLEKHNVKECGAAQPHKHHFWYDLAGKKLFCEGREAPPGWVDPKLRRKDNK